MNRNCLTETVFQQVFLVEVRRLSKQITLLKQWENWRALGLQNSANILSGKYVACVGFHSQLVAEQRLEPNNPWLWVATFIPAAGIAVVTFIFCCGHN